MVVELVESRRLTGPNLLSDYPGAIIDINCNDQARDLLVNNWQQAVSYLLNYFDLSNERSFVRKYKCGASLAISAPIDMLYSATELNEWALEIAIDFTEKNKLVTPELELDSNQLAIIKKNIDNERNPKLLELIHEAEQRGLKWLCDDEQLSIGFGKGGITYCVNALPDINEIPWSLLSNIPVVVITGTNGKSTSTRLLAHILSVSGFRVGYSCTEGIFVETEPRLSGDYSGPGGARALLRQKDIDIAVLEVARGGLLRRGVGVLEADAGLVTNVSADHLGEYGIYDLKELCQAKCIIAKALTQQWLVLNADDALLQQQAKTLQQKIAWFSLDENNMFKQPSSEQKQLSDDQVSAFVKDNRVFIKDNLKMHDVCSVQDIPITWQGRARFNISNVLGVCLLAYFLDTSIDHIKQGLMTFSSTPDTNPGRSNRMTIDGIDVIVDFAHNPAGISAMVEAASQLPANKRIIMLGSAGDRDDSILTSMALSALLFKPDKIIIVELLDHLRGRKPKEIPEFFRNIFLSNGITDAQIKVVTGSLEGVQVALESAQAGDLLLLLTLADKQAVFDYLEKQSSLSKNKV